MRVVVVGGGYGGIASAGRLAKLGHAVTLLEATDALGGALRSSTDGDFTWEPSHATLLPAAMRDLFRKSGRPLEREPSLGDLEPLEIIREHRFPDRTRLSLPGGSQAAQVAAFDELGAGLGTVWAAYVASYAADWEVLRQGYFEVPLAPTPSPDVLARLRSREPLRRRLHRSFRDKRLRLVAGHPVVATGSRLRDTPAWAGLGVYLEQRFGVWTVPGGMHLVTDALAARMETRGVAVQTGTPARDVVVRAGRAVAVATDGGSIDADAVVVAIDPRRLPALANHVKDTLPAIPPRIIHLGLSDAPALPAEVVLHGDPTLVVRARGNAWTVQVHGKLLEDVTWAMARHRLDVRARVVTQIEHGPAELVGAWGGSPLGVRWSGRRTVFDRVGPRTPLAGVYAAGAHAATLPGLPGAALSAATVAQAITTDAGGGDLRA